MIIHAAINDPFLNTVTFADAFLDYSIICYTKKGQLQFPKAEGDICNMLGLSPRNVVWQRESANCHDFEAWIRNFFCILALKMNRKTSSVHACYIRMLIPASCQFTGLINAYFGCAHPLEFPLSTSHSQLWSSQHERRAAQSSTEAKMPEEGSSELCRVAEDPSLIGAGRSRTVTHARSHRTQTSHSLPAPELQRLPLFKQSTTMGSS